jgi:hypothetical protein
MGNGIRKFLANFVILIGCVLYVPCIIIAAFVDPEVTLKHLDRICQARKHLYRDVKSGAPK